MTQKRTARGHERDGERGAADHQPRPPTLDRTRTFPTVEPVIWQVVVRHPQQRGRLAPCESGPIERGFGTGRSLLR